MTSVSANLPARVAPGTPIERIQAIKAMMLAGEFERGETGAALAKQWGVSEETVRQAANAASAIIRSAMSDDDYRSEIIGRVDELVEMARSGRDIAAALNGLKLMLEARGLLKQRHEVTVSAKAPAEVYADALLDDGFRAYLLSQGWTAPKRLVETTGENIE